MAGGRTRSGYSKRTRSAPQSWRLMVEVEVLWLYEKVPMVLKASLGSSGHESMPDPIPIPSVNGRIAVTVPVG